MVFGGGAFGKHLGHEGGGLTNGISALRRTDQRPSSLCFCQVRTQREVRSLQHETGPSPEPDPDTLTLDCSPQNYEKQISVVYKTGCLECFVIAAWTDKTLGRDNYSQNSCSTPASGLPPAPVPLREFVSRYLWSSSGCQLLLLTECLSAWWCEAESLSVFQV